MLFSIACFAQDKNYVSVHRDSLYNALLNISELKVENAFLRKKNDNQKVIITAQEIIISETEFKTEILTKQISIEQGTGTKKWWNGFGKGVATGGVIVLGLFLGLK